MAFRVRNILASLSALVLLPAAVAAGPAGGTFGGDPQAVAEVLAAYQKFFSAKTYRARMTFSGGQGSVTQTTEYVMPDRLRFVMTLGSDTMEVTRIASDTWIRQGGRCTKVPAAAAPPVRNPREAIEHAADTKVTVTRGGAETIEGTPTQTYGLTIETQGRQLRQKLYVATTTGYPRRIEMPADQGNVTIDYFDFDAAIAIGPPC